MKIYQLSTKTCGPCKMAKKTIEQIEDHNNWWEWVDIEENNDEVIQSLVNHINPRSVPTFVVADLNKLEIYEVFNGFNLRKVMIAKEQYYDGELMDVKNTESTLDNTEEE